VKLWTPMHLAGFAVMTIVSAGAAAGLGLVLATACRTRAQLDGLVTIVILLMPAWMKQVGLVTFNARALDSYQKVFWYERGILEPRPQLLVLAGFTGAFLVAARLLARGGECV
jgi:ABC-2 type transport system permease protein